jgi:hypothetical protein
MRAATGNGRGAAVSDDDRLAIGAANRALTYGAQLAQIGVDGLLRSFLGPPLSEGEIRQAREVTEPSEGTTIA